ncbi:MAG: histidine triad nucleotide-binding protein [Acidobacteria bacterium]|uniref:Histidine triad nucleotide-binding protein n=1 Tax=Candidatus Polarisedimenticola svalbardensis TaxID=2886004 RepID=A0A8J7CCN3_9BACT|nr:histidine triad nucleotide-binding protein [Candidatus Polarisedimenticola svalbardensis]
MSDCVFCSIATGKIPSDMVYQDEQLVAFRDLNPQAPVHVLIIPRAHLASLAEAGPEHGPVLGHVLLAAGEIARQEGVGDGYRVVNNCGESAGQTVFHVHFHLLGGRDMGWPPG